MIENEQADFTAMWRAAHEAYKSKPSDMAVRLAWETLKDYQYQDIAQALTAHMKDPDGGRFAPKPADITLKIDGDPESRAYQAYTKALDAIGSVGPHKSVVFDDRLIMCCLQDVGGWQVWNEQKDEEIPFRKNEFIKRYRGYLNKPPESHPPKLTGIIEAQNSKIAGAKPQDPVLIGNAQKATEVNQAGIEKPQGMKTLGQAMKMLGVDKNGA